MAQSSSSFPVAVKQKQPAQNAISRVLIKEMTNELEIS
jgi:hypothetical protein